MWRKTFFDQPTLKFPLKVSLLASVCENRCCVRWYNDSRCTQNTFSKCIDEGENTIKYIIEYM